jgi:hypothetical protein
MRYVLLLTTLVSGCRLGLRPALLGWGSTVVQLPQAVLKRGRYLLCTQGRCEMQVLMTRAGRYQLNGPTCSQGRRGPGGSDGFRGARAKIGLMERALP